MSGEAKIEYNTAGFEFQQLSVYMNIGRSGLPASDAECKVHFTYDGIISLLFDLDCC